MSELLDLEVEIDRLRQALTDIVKWSESYPLNIFPEPDWKEARKALEAAGMTLDAVSAGCMRHVITSVGKLAREALAGEENV